MVNPFSGLSTIEALAAAEKFLEVSKNSKNINSYEAMIRRLQFENSQPRAILTEKGKKIIKGWKELESFLE